MTMDDRYDNEDDVYRKYDNEDDEAFYRRMCALRDDRERKQRWEGIIWVLILVAVLTFIAWLIPGCPGTGHLFEVSSWECYYDGDRDNPSHEF
jgi:hypothetical protein